MTPETGSLEIDKVKNPSLEHEIETKFIDAMLGKSELPKEHPSIIYPNYLMAAYRQAKAMELSENLILKHCCVVLMKIINNNYTEKLNEKLTNVERVVK